MCLDKVIGVFDPPLPEAVDVWKVVEKRKDGEMYPVFYRCQPIPDPFLPGIRSMSLEVGLEWYDWIQTDKGVYPTAFHSFPNREDAYKYLESVKLYRVEHGRYPRQYCVIRGRAEQVIATGEQFEAPVIVSRVFLPYPDVD